MSENGSIALHALEVSGPEGSHPFLAAGDPAPEVTEALVLDFEAGARMWWSWGCRSPTPGGREW